MAIFAAYRQKTDEREWHFHTQCPDWPEKSYVQKTYREPSDRLCEMCIKLERKMSSHPE
jgi:hypothetical protein